MKKISSTLKIGTTANWERGQSHKVPPDEPQVVTKKFAQAHLFLLCDVTFVITTTTGTEQIACSEITKKYCYKQLYIFMGSSAFKTIAVPKGLHALYMTLCLYIYLQKLHSGPILSVQKQPHKNTEQASLDHYHSSPNKENVKVQSFIRFM